MFSPEQIEDIFFVMRKRGNSPWEVIGEEPTLDLAIEAIPPDHLPLVDDSQNYGHSEFIYKITMVVAEGMSNPLGIRRRFPSARPSDRGSTALRMPKC